MTVSAPQNNEESNVEMGAAHQDVGGAMFRTLTMHKIKKINVYIK